MREDHQSELGRLTLDLEDESSRTTSMDRRLTDLRREVRSSFFPFLFLHLIVPIMSFGKWHCLVACALTLNILFVMELRGNGKTVQ